MAGIKGVKGISELMAALAAAVEAAGKAGLTSEQIAAALETVKDTIENED